MDNEEKLGILIAVIVLFGGAIWGWWKNRASKQQVSGALYNQPELTAGAADGSLARVGGTVVATTNLLMSPLAQRQCVMYWTRIITASGENKDRIQFVPFAIDRGAEGTVQIDATFAQMNLSPIAIPQNGAVLEAFAMAMGLTVRDAGTAQFYEIVIEPGQRVTVAGTVMIDGGGGAQGYRGSGTQYKIAGNQQHPIMIGQ